MPNKLVVGDLLKHLNPPRMMVSDVYRVSKIEPFVFSGNEDIITLTGVDAPDIEYLVATRPNYPEIFKEYEIVTNYAPSSKPICWVHEWVDYQGFREQYQYCKYCDEKIFNKKL